LPSSGLGMFDLPVIDFGLEPRRDRRYIQSTLVL
jgi:hypothetical protein